jgi:hypothetical protein
MNSNPRFRWFGHTTADCWAACYLREGSRIETDRGKRQRRTTGCARRNERCACLAFTGAFKIRTTRATQPCRDGFSGSMLVEGAGARANPLPSTNSLLVLRGWRGDSQIVSDTSYAFRIPRDRYNTRCHVRILYLATQGHDASRGGDVDIVGFNVLATSKRCLHLCSDCRIT